MNLQLVKSIHFPQVELIRNYCYILLESPEKCNVIIILGHIIPTGFPSYFNILKQELNCILCGLKHLTFNLMNSVTERVYNKKQISLMVLLCIVFIIYILTQDTHYSVDRVFPSGFGDSLEIFVVGSFRG